MTSMTRLAISALLVAAGAVVFFLKDQPVEMQTTSLALPSEVTPEIVATRGCIEGVAHPSEERIGFHAQWEACDALEPMGNFGTLPRRFRAEMLLEEGLTEAHMTHALQDFDVLVEEGPTTWALVRRATQSQSVHAV